MSQEELKAAMADPELVWSPWFRIIVTNFLMKVIKYLQQNLYAATTYVHVHFLCNNVGFVLNVVCLFVSGGQIWMRFLMGTNLRILAAFIKLWILLAEVWEIR